VQQFLFPVFPLQSFHLPHDHMLLIMLLHLQSALQKKVKGNDVSKIQLKQLYGFYSKITKSEVPMKPATFREYVELNRGLSKASKEFLHELFDTVKGWVSCNDSVCFGHEC
jgi:hypothetical protein